MVKVFQMLIECEMSMNVHMLIFLWLEGWASYCIVPGDNHRRQ